MLLYIIVCGCIGCGFEVELVECYMKCVIWVQKILEFFDIGGCVFVVFVGSCIVLFDEGGEQMLLFEFVKLLEKWCDGGVCEV